MDLIIIAGLTLIMLVTTVMTVESSKIIVYNTKQWWECLNSDYLKHYTQAHTWTVFVTSVILVVLVAVDVTAATVLLTKLKGIH